MNDTSMMYEIFVDQNCIDKHVLNVPMQIHKVRYMQLIQQLKGDSRPMMFRITAPDEIIWDQFEQKQKTIQNYIEFRNTAYLDKYGSN